MPPVGIELGELEHVQDGQNLKLRTNVTLSLSHMPHLYISEPLHTETLVSNGTWTAGGNRLLIHVRLIFNDVGLSGYENASIVEDIGEKLCNSEIWSQLDFDAKHHVTGDDAEGSSVTNEFVLILTRRTSGQTSANAPQNVPSARLESVNLLFSFSTCRRNRTSFIPIKQAVHTALPEFGAIDDLGRPCGHPQPEQQWPHINDQSVSQAQNGETGSPDERQMTLRTATESLSFEMLTSNARTSVSLRPRHSLESTSTYSPLSLLPDSKQAIHRVELDHLLSILDASLRLLVCDREAPKRQGVILSKDTGFPRLVRISPALFSPRFLKTISELDGLPPKIARTICGVYRRTRSGGLKRVLECLLTTPPNRKLSYGTTRLDATQSDTAKLDASIQARIWYLMQQKLLDPYAWPRRHFNVLSGPQKICRRERGSLMLDDSLTDQYAETDLSNMTNNLLPKSQYTSMVDILETGGHDTPRSVDSRLSDNGPFVAGDPQTEYDAAGKALFLPEWKTATDYGGKEESLSCKQTDTLNDAMDEDLFRSERCRQGAPFGIGEDMFDHVALADQESIYHSQVPSASLGQGESLDGWNARDEEMLDDQHDFLEHHEIHSDRFVLHAYSDEDHGMVLKENNNHLDGDFAHCPARKAASQELLDARQDVRKADRAFNEGTILRDPGQMDHEEMLDVTQGIAQQIQDSSGKSPPHTPWKRVHLELSEETEIIVDPQFASVLGAEFAGEFLGHEGDEMLDGERMMMFDAYQWNEASLVV